MPPDHPPEVSIVVPVYNEEGAAAPLAEEIAAAFEGVAHEIVFVDDASRDATRERLKALQTRVPQLRVLQHRSNAGQSRAVRTGVLAARGPIVVTLDGDGQNDPADAPRLAARLGDGPASWPLWAAKGSSAGTRPQSAGPRERRTASANGCSTIRRTTRAAG